MRPSATSLLSLSLILFHIPCLLANPLPPAANLEQAHQRALDYDDAVHEILEAKGPSVKVVQIADMHLSTFRNGRICDSPKPGRADSCSDDDTIAFVDRLLDVEKPDLVVFSGDNVNGETTDDAGKIIRRYAETCISRGIPWIHIFGNHDDEIDVSQNMFADRLGLFEIGKTLPYSITHKGPKGVNGIGNGFVSLTSKGRTLGRVWYLDSGNYIDGGPDHGGKYGFIHQDQVDWYRDAASRIPPSPVDITFFHIPTTDWNNVQHRVGQKNEDVMEQGKPTQILTAMNEKVGLQVASTGHDHTNDYWYEERGSIVRWAPSGWETGLNVDGKTHLCYGGGIGYGRAYGSRPPSPYFSKRARVFRLTVVTDEETRLETWKRVDDDALSVVDRQTIGVGSTERDLPNLWRQGLRR
ncbi:hypothetical protein HKX48_005187 [Thoreauomyces humboldtii]|nr:hypothetical protein HKX48_005187 [Thoreauomyces humboldtii]